jgi:hypothetical protein
MIVLRALIPSVVAATMLIVAPARASTLLDDAVADVESRLLSSYRPGMPMPVNSPRTIDKVEYRARPPADEYGLRFFRDLQVRRSGSASYFIGDGLPVDAVTGSLPGTLLAVRFGAGLRSLGIYGVLGAGTFTTYRHLIPRRDFEPVQVATESSPFAFVGVGFELHLYREVVVAAEANWGTVIASHGPDRVLTPAPAETVSSAVGALRVRY